MHRERSLMKTKRRRQGLGQLKLNEVRGEESGILEQERKLRW
jgi:hypothetical protein